ncbi:hypothetical protein BGZ58_002286 [Dissophora ornata]|nr:hypothetical protein BGZ58_002286 [Dissophora ornata]
MDLQNLSLSDSPPGLHPLLLPEVVRHLGDYLARPQVVCCLRVCKTWRAALEFILWGTLTLQNQPCNFTPPQPSPSLLLRNRHHIRHLNEIGSNSLLKFMAFSTQAPPMQLTSISCTILSPEILMIASQNIETITSFTCRSNRLRKDEEAQGLWYRQLFSILEEAPRLLSLAIGPVILLDLPKEMLSKVSRTLKYLELDRVKITTKTLSAATIVEGPESGNGYSSFELFPELEELRLIWNDFPPQSQLEIVRQSPKLKTLSWRRSARFLSQAWLSGSLAVPAGLTKLDIGHSHIDDVDMATLLSLTPNLRALNARGTPFGTRSALQLLESPEMVDQMEELELLECMNLSSAMVQTFLRTLHNLRKFSASRVEAADIARTYRNAGNNFIAIPTSVPIQRLGREPSPTWGCLGLEVLELGIVGLYRCRSPGPVEARSFIYEQLEQLTQLQVLTLSENSSLARESDYLLDLRLDSELYLLRGLKRLRELNVMGLRPKMQMDDIRWIATEWVGLKKLRGKLNCVDDEDYNKKLETELKRLRPDIMRA